ncbi:MAG: GNAT family N-acetyltransferase [Pseudonocardiaceae bacterium]
MLVFETRLPAQAWFWSGGGLDQEAVLAAFDEQIRRHRGPDVVSGPVEHDECVIRSAPVPGGWTGVTWSDLDPLSADGVIAEQVNRFAGLARPWEWKHYSYDQPVELPERLVAAGFTPGPAEAVLVAEIAELDLSVPPPVGVELRAVLDQHGVEALVAVHDEVFGGDHFAVGQTLLADLGLRPTTTAAVVAVVVAVPVAAGRVEFHPGTDFASLWGGGTLSAWRGHGVFRSLVAHRAAAASARGFRYLQVDASTDSRPILQRLGFVELATTTPFAHQGAPG